ncbi:MAG: hypothetical protein LQ346_005051 [Caloplaca aetnensis]|nr:MAG: hypothetical protein LQ346_005051 [Caloplaca aetnensis]
MSNKQSTGRPKTPASKTAAATQLTSTRPSLPQPEATDPKPTIIPTEGTPYQYVDDAVTGTNIQTSHFNGRPIRPKPKPYRRAKATRQPRPSPPQKYTAWSANAPPFQWFTQRGQRPLDEDADVVWEHYKGRYYASRLSTLEHDPSVEPKLMTSRTAFWVIPNAKRDLTQAKRKRTGDPNTRWNTEVPPPPAKRTRLPIPQLRVTTAAVDRDAVKGKEVVPSPEKHEVSHTEEIQRPVSPKKQRVTAGSVAFRPSSAAATTAIIDDTTWTRRPDLDSDIGVTGTGIEEPEQAGWFGGSVNVGAQGIDASISDDYDWLEWF